MLNKIKKVGLTAVLTGAMLGVQFLIPNIIGSAKAVTTERNTHNRAVIIRYDEYQYYYKNNRRHHRHHHRRVYPKIIIIIDRDTKDKYEYHNPAMRGGYTHNYQYITVSHEYYQKMHHRLNNMTSIEIDTRSNTILIKTSTGNFRTGDIHISTQ